MKSLIKPKFAPFVIYTNIISVLVLSIVTIIGIILSLLFMPILSSIIGLFGFGIIMYTIINQYYKYKKESYEIHVNEFIKNGGSLFSDDQTELVFKNVTNIIHIKPFLEYKLFKTSHILIESAGSATTEMYLKSIENGDELYNTIIQKLKTKFDLDQKEKISARPSKLGILVDTIKQLLVGFISFIIIVLSTGAIQAELLSSESINKVVLLFIILLGVIILGFIFFQTILKVLDKYYRKYTLSKSAAIYTEGFLTKVKEIIPFENVSDINSEQTLFDRLIGTTTVVISCQGQSQNISFSYVPQAEKMISFLKESVEPLKEKKLSADTIKTSAKKESKETKKNNVSFEEQTFGMNKARAIIGSLFTLPLIIIPPAIFIVIIAIGYAVIRAYNTHFIIERKKMTSHFAFIQKKTVSFSVDKITGVHVKTNIIDRLFNTNTVHFWSIGSPLPLIFTHISKEKAQEIITELGFTDKRKQKEFTPSCNPISFIQRYFYIMILGIIGIIIIPFNYFIGGLVVIILTIIGVFEFVREFIYYSHAKIETYPTYTKFIQGILFHKESYAYDEHVKGLTALQYPFTRIGTVSMNVAGESFPTAENQKGGPVSHKISMPFMSNCLTHELMPRQTKQIIQIKPQQRNILLSAIFILPIPFIPLLALMRHYVSYQIQSNQIIAKKGILYKSQKHILNTKIDYVSKQAGFIHKIAKNATISIHTTGSSMTEMYLLDIKKYDESYKIIQETYRK